MKIILSLTIVALLWLVGSDNVQAQSSLDEHPVEFKIQLAASAKPLSKQNKLYIDFPELEEIDLGDGYLRYYVGSFHTFFEAKSYNKENVRAKGYKESYVVGFHNGKRVTVDEAISIIYKEE